MRATIGSNYEMRRGQCLNLIVHVHAGPKTAMQNKHRWPDAVGCVVNTNSIDLGILPAVRFAANECPDIKLQPC